MSKYSMVHKGEVLPYKFKKMKGVDAVNFYCGDILLGQIFKMKSYYSAVSFTMPPDHINHVDGFKARWNACEWLIKVFKHCDGENNYEDK